MNHKLIAGSLLTICPALVAAGTWTPGDDPTRDDDGQHRVVYAMDPITGEPLFAGDIAPNTPSTSFARDIMSQALPRSSSPQGSPVQMRHVDTVSSSLTTLSSENGFDSDHDGRAEFVIWKAVGGTTWTTIYEFYESVDDGSFNAFDLVHVLEIPPQGDSSYNLGDLGDADGDGLTELVLHGRTNNDFFIRLYESESTDTHPTELVWEVGGNVSDGWFWQEGAKIADTDRDGKQEIVTAGQLFGAQRIAVYENDGDNSFDLVFSQAFPIETQQSMEVANDLDGDGADEIFFGGLESGADAGKIYAVENTGDNTYQQIWSTELIYDKGELINVEFIVDAGDLDGDGRKEFLAGGRKASLPPWSSILYVFEAIADNDFQIVASLSLPMNLGLSRANAADVDGDGSREIVFGTDQVIKLYSNVGDNAWEEIWSETAGVRSIGAGDHDGDGKTEIISQKSSSTWIWEIHPQYAADADGDGLTDVVDNCPLTANPGQEDADNDTVGNVCDNCIYGPNPAQGLAIFGQDVVAENPQTFSWPLAADVVYVKGNLAGVSTYTVDLVQTLPLGTSFMDPSVPDTGEGFFYLVKPDCGVGSWQTTLGAEPGRDAALP